MRKNGKTPAYANDDVARARAMEMVALWSADPQAWVDHSKARWKG